MHAAGAVRSPLARQLVPALLGLLCGTALQLQQRALWSLAAYAALLCAGAGIALVLAWRVRARWFGCGAMVTAFALIAAGQVGLRSLHYQARALPSAHEGRNLQLTGIVAAMPQRTPLGWRLLVQVEQARRDGAPIVLPSLVQLAWVGRSAGGVAQQGSAPASARASELGQADEDHDRPTALGAAALPRAGERWQFTVRLKAPHGHSNPFGFDYELWLWEHGIGAIGYVRDQPPHVPPSRIDTTWQRPVEAMRQSVRDRIGERVADPRAAGWIAALVVGDQNAIERGDWDIFRATGVAHLMSISGLHVTMFAWLATTIAGRLWRRSAACCLWLPAPHAALLAGWLAACAYALFSGWGVPAQRTVWMLAVVCVLRLAARRWPWPLVWLLAAALVVVVDPWALLQSGFWLSFVAVAVLFASGEAAAAPTGWWARARALLREQLVLTLALTPLVLLLFGQVSLVGLVANLLAIPWVTLVVTPLAMAGVVWSGFWELAAGAVTLLAMPLQAMARWPFASVWIAIAPGWLGAAGVAGGILLALRLPLPLRLAGAGLVLPVLLWQAPRPAPGEFELLVADVGQGNAVLVRTAHHALLYDSGPRYSRDSDAGQRVLVPLLRAYAERLDTLVVSHGDADHVGGAAAVLAMQPQAGLLSSLEPGALPLQGTPAVRCGAGQRWEWDGVDFTVLHPRAQDYTAAPRPNALSCVLRIATRASVDRPAAAALLTGDIEAAQEARLLAEAAPLAADLLLVPHHGSQTSSSTAFVQAVSARLAVVQSGYRNRFGHPAAGPLERYRASGAQVHDSPRCGAMSWRSHAPQWLSCHREQTRRYWHHVVPP